MPTYQVTDNGRRCGQPVDAETPWDAITLQTGWPLDTSDPTLMTANESDGNATAVLSRPRRKTGTAVLTASQMSDPETGNSAGMPD